MLFLNEVKYAIRQPFLVLTIVVISLLSTVIGLGGIEQDATISDTLQIFSLIQMLFLPFAIAILATEIFVRDINSNMLELIDSTPLNNKLRYLMRLAAHLFFASIPFCLALLIISFSHFELKESLQLFSFGYFVVFLPNLLFISSIVIFVARKCTNNFTTYAVSALIGVGYIILGSMLGFPFLTGSSIVSESLYNIMIWLDPLATTTLLHIAGSDATLLNKEILINRLTTLMFSIAVIWFTLRTTEKLNLETKKSKKTSTEKKDRGSFISPKSQLSALVFCSMSTILRSRVNQVILLLWLGTCFNEVLSGLTAFQQNGKHQLTSIDAINLVASDLLLVFGSIITAFWSWIVCWNEKKLNFAEIVAATPVSNITKITAQCITMALLVLIVALLAATSTMVAEIGLNTTVMVNQYFLLFTIAIIPLMLLSVLCVVVHNFVSSSVKAGVILTALLVVKFTPVTSSLGLTHLLWNIAGSPIQEANNFWGLDGSISSLTPFVVFWILITTTLFSFAVKRSHRGTGLLNSNKAGSFSKLTSLVLVLVSLSSGFFIDKQLTTEKPLTFKAQQDSWQVHYEENYNEWKLTKQPTLTHVNSMIDLYPNKGIADINLQYFLSNYTNQPISKILVGRNGNYTSWKIIKNSAFELIEDAYSQQKIVQLKQPLLPGDQLVLNIDIDYKQPVFWPVNSSVVVKKSFTNILAEKFIPRIGYQPSFETRDKSIRKKNNLGEVSPLIEQNTQVTFSNTIGTSKNYVVVSQGTLEKQWFENDRTYVYYTANTTSEFKLVWLSLPKNSINTQSKNKTTSLYTPAHFNAPEEVIDVLSDAFEHLNNYLASNTKQKLTIVAAPEVKEAFYITPDLILFDHDDILRHLSYQNENLPLIYKQMLTPLIEQIFINNKIDLSSPTAALIHGHMLLSIIERQFGEEPRKQVLEAAVKQHKLLSVLAANSKTSLSSETIKLKTSLHSIQLAEQLEDIVGKAKMREAIQLIVLGNEEKTIKRLIMLLKNSQPETKQVQVDEAIAGAIACD